MMGLLCNCYSSFYHNYTKSQPWTLVSQNQLSYFDLFKNWDTYVSGLPLEGMSLRPCVWWPCSSLKNKFMRYTK
jgi:hypothetical protein